MLTAVTNITIILILLSFLFMGYSAGIIKSSFAAAAGFFSLLLAESYPNQAGINYCFVFVSTAVFIFIVGILTFRAVKFLYLSLFDKIAGACLGIFLGFVVAVNFVVPTADKAASIICDIRVKSEQVSNFSSKILPMFGKYTPEPLSVLDNSDFLQIFKEGLKNFKNFNSENIDVSGEF